MTYLCKPTLHPDSDRHHLCRQCWRDIVSPRRRAEFDQPIHPNLAPRDATCCRCRDGKVQPCVPVMHVYDEHKRSSEVSS